MSPFSPIIIAQRQALSAAELRAAAAESEAQYRALSKRGQCRTVFTEVEWEEVVRTVVAGMREHLSHYRTPVFEDHGDHGDGCGTGSYVCVDERIVVLTNEHVAGVRRQNRFLAHQFLHDENLYRVVGNHFDFPWPFDLAVLPVSAEAWAEKPLGSQAIEIDQIALAHDPVPGELLTFTGFSGEATDLRPRRSCLWRNDCVRGADALSGMSSPAKLRIYTTAGAIPAASGAYLLALNLKWPLAIARPSPVTLRAGYYLYAGSARGPGGLQARIARHMRRPKHHHWHVDQISAVADVVGAFVWPGGSECALAAQWARFGTAVAGFGSSDCRRCRSHLLGPLASLPDLPASGDEA